MTSRAVKRLGIIDLGSHSVHFELFGLGRKHEPRSVYSKSEPSHMGRVVGEKGLIPRSLASHLKKTVAAYCKKAKKKGAQAILIGATAGFRSASNGPEILRHLEKQVGYPMHILDPERESQLGFKGIESELSPGESQVFIDCGGGSTEVSIARGRHRLNHVTLPYGSSLLSLKIQNDPPRLSDIAQLVFPWMETWRMLPRTPHPTRALVSGGTIADLTTLLSDKTPETITLMHLNTAVEIVLRKRFKKIARKYDLSLENARNLLPAAVTLTFLLTTYGLDRAAYTRKSLRDGMALAYQKRGEQWWKPDVARHERD